VCHNISSLIPSVRLHYFLLLSEGILNNQIQSSLVYFCFSVNG
jgi:hypothetical protein